MRKAWRQLLHNVVCNIHNLNMPMNYKTGSYTCRECEAEIPPPLPKEATIKCQFCKEPCGNDWCCVKDKK